MDRFAWSDGSLTANEQLVLAQTGIQLYDGEEKTKFSNGRLQLTSHQLVWTDARQQKCVLSLSLSCVVYIEEHSASFTKSAKIVLHLHPRSADSVPGPVSSSCQSHIRLSFREGGHSQFYSQLMKTLERKAWTTTSQPAGSRPARSGIGGIERRLEQKNKETNQHISVAFEDLTKLMDKAKEMVTLSRNISDKIREKKGDISEDETIRFKSYLLSLGIADPVTRESHGTGNSYFTQLAKQVSSTLLSPLQDCGGMMTLTDAYCRVNRARGMELLSPDDLLNACHLMDSLKLPMRLHQFASGVVVVQLRSQNEAEMAKQTTALVSEAGSLTAEELSHLIGVSVVLSKERLISTETLGAVCRDETIEGLRFYPNLLLTKA